MKIEEIILNVERQVKLTAYIQEVNGEFSFSKRPAVLILPGGGYAMCSDREADPVAMQYLKVGYQVFILRYTVKSYGGWPNPLNDYEQVMELIKARADEWSVQPDKIAVVGFSAGGHLAACAATVATNRPAAAILVYPAILKDIVDMCQPGMPYPAEHVSEDTCPCFIVATRDDNMVPIQNSLAFGYSLAEKGIAFESHIYSYGQHGFSTAESHLNIVPVCPRLSQWMADSIAWLDEVMGALTTKGFTEPAYEGHMNHDGGAVLSVNCTLGHIFNQSQEVQELLGEVHEGLQAIAEERGYSKERLVFAMRKATLKEILLTLGITDTKLTKIEAELRQFSNQIPGE